MSISILKGDHVDAHLWLPVEEVESSALDQIRALCALPVVHGHVAIMPDVHLGVGCTIGTVVALKDAVIPSAVGVDPGCGMGAVRLGCKVSDLPADLKGLRQAIEASTPVGFNAHPTPVWTRSRTRQSQAAQLLDWSLVAGDSCKDKASHQLGTLGGGNHFIEVCGDGRDDAWLLLHTGSRNAGKRIADYWIFQARDTAAPGIPRDLGWLTGSLASDYLSDLTWAQSYAALNRKLIAERVVAALVKEGVPVRSGVPIWCHHNYIAQEIHGGVPLNVTRKGAIRAGQGEFALIPGSMGTRSYVVQGLGNPESYKSASHGAGRRMSRGAAKRSFTLADLGQQTLGVECRKDEGVLDEAPGAYKDIDQVMANQTDLVQVVYTLRALLCVKG